MCQHCYSKWKRIFLVDYEVDPTPGLSSIENGLRAIKRTERRRGKKMIRSTRHRRQGKHSPSDEKQRRKAIFESWDCQWLEIIRRSKEYQEWRIRVLERDEYTCQHCEQHGGRLHVHHEKSARLHPDSIFDENNAIVLCQKCHQDLHIERYDKRSKPKVIKLQVG